MATVDSVRAELLRAGGAVPSLKGEREARRQPLPGSGLLKHVTLFAMILLTRINLILEFYPIGTHLVTPEEVSSLMGLDRHNHNMLFFPLMPVVYVSLYLPARNCFRDQSLSTKIQIIIPSIHPSILPCIHSPFCFTSFHWAI